MVTGRTVVTAQATRRWALMLTVLMVLTAIPLILNVWPARASVDPATLRQRITASARQPYQGYAQSSGLLGLPSLPNLTEVTNLVSGTTEMRTWYAAKDRWRVDVLGPGTERDVYQTPGSQYVWDYGDNHLTRIDGDPPIRLPRAADLTPPELVRRILATGTGDRLDPLPAKRVAGIQAAGVRLLPAGADTTVAHVDIWADPATGLPLQAEVTAKGGLRPVFMTRFLEIELRRPDDTVLTPPAPRDGIGFHATEAPDILTSINRRRPVSLPAGLAGQPRRNVVAGLAVADAYGTGLSSFVVVALPGRFGGPAFQRITAFGTPVEGADASVIATGLLSVLIVRTTERYYLLAGLVEPALLQRAAVDLAKGTR